MASQSPGLALFDRRPRLRRPGLFVTGTDTGVGKTLVACALAAALRQQQPGWHVGVCKPFASGCRRDREGLVHEDAEALAHFADCRLPLQTIAPIRFKAPLAPAVAAELLKQDIDRAALRQSFEQLDQHCDAIIVEGVGGVMVPLDQHRPQLTVLDLAATLNYPVLVVARSVLGTLNHTAMTVRLLRESGCTVTGIVMNGYDADDMGADPSIATNQRWLKKMTGVPVLAVVPRVKPESAQPQRARLDDAVLEAIALVDWPTRLARPMRH